MAVFHRRNGQPESDFNALPSEVNARKVAVILPDSHESAGPTNSGRERALRWMEDVLPRLRTARERTHRGERGLRGCAQAPPYEYWNFVQRRASRPSSIRLNFQPQTKLGGDRPCPSPAARAQKDREIGCQRRGGKEQRIGLGAAHSVAGSARLGKLAQALLLH
jgi:hypothetical protein